MRHPAESWRSERWPEGVRKWFIRKIMASLAAFRDSDGNAPWFRRALADRDVFMRVVIWYCDRLDQFVVHVEPDAIWVSEWEYDDERIQYSEERVSGKAFTVVRGAEQALAAVREFKTYDNLDSWLGALLAGKLERTAPSEPKGHNMVADAGEFLAAMWKRRRSWPRPCADCGQEFRPDRANVKRCPTCRSTRNPCRKRYEPRPCADCGDAFRPRNWNAKYCDGCRQARADVMSGKRAAGLVTRLRSRTDAPGQD